MRTEIVIINYRTGQLTIDCLQSLVPEMARLPDAHVTIVDNASGDDSLGQIEEAIAANGWGQWVSPLPLDRNTGFAGGNNAGIRRAFADPAFEYIILLNPDTIVHPGGMCELIAFMDAQPTIGMAGSRLENPDGTPQRSAFRFPSVFSELDGGLRLGVMSRILSRWVVAPPVPAAACQVDWVAAASMIIRRNVFESVGLMDEEYFMYFEEVDFCRHALQAGHTCWYVPASRIIHLVGQASGVTDPKQSHKRRPRYWFDSRRRFFLKNFNPVYAALADLTYAASFALWCARRFIQRKPDTDPACFLRDLLRNSVFVRGFGL